MSRIAYVNGRYESHARAQVSIDDRGYQFADGVYEVVEVHEHALIDEDLHFERLARSLSELAIAAPLDRSALALVMREVVRRNRVRHGMVYAQVSRGVAARDHVFPPPSTRSSLVVTARSHDPDKAEAKAAAGIKVVTMPDIRWKRPDIKSISLLPNVLAKQEAKRRGAAEAWLTDDRGLITEGAASNAWIVLQDGRLVTRPADRSILRGVTRTTLLRLMAERHLVLEERGFTREEAFGAREAFVTGATTLVTPVGAIDDRPVGDGRPGALTMTLRAAFHGAAQRSALSPTFA